MRSEGQAGSDHCRPRGEKEEFRFLYKSNREAKEDFKVREWEDLVYNFLKK